MTRRELRLDKAKTRPGQVLAVLAAFLSYSTSGCFSNRYVIAPEELARLAQIPPQVRGERVLVVQELGERRSPAIEGGAMPTLAAPAEPAPGFPPGPEQVAGDPGPLGQPEVMDSGPNVHVGVGAYLDLGPHGVVGGHRSHAPSAGRLADGRPTGASALPTPPPRPAATPGVARGGIPARAASSGGSSSSGGDDLALVAVVVAALAVLAVAGLAVTEGVRFDGAVQMTPWQPVHLQLAGGEQVVALGDLDPALAASAESAQVMDDEGWGMLRLQRRPLDRRGFAFKVDVGALESLCACYSLAGVGSNIQFGYFPHHRVGLLGTLSLGGGTDPVGDAFQRHSLALEAQWFPLNLWRLHLGAFGHGGVQFAEDTTSGSREGAAFGGGLLLEVALATRLAFMVRADWTTARVGRSESGAAGWVDAAMYTAGLAVY